MEVKDAEVIPATADRDWGLVEALRQGEATAAECLVATFGDRACRLAIGITGNQEDAEEAVQDAFWNVIRKIDTFRGESSFRSWIYRITANRSEEHTSELQSLTNLVCRLLLEKKKIEKHG